MTKEYTIDCHRHIFAAWAASRAASVKGYRFKVETGKKIIEHINLDTIQLNNLPSDNDAFDKEHKRWCETIISMPKGIEIEFTHGIAAKLINVYLKSKFVCGESSNHPKVALIHPPIDRLLLRELIRNSKTKSSFRSLHAMNWSTLDYEHYMKIIGCIRDHLDGAPLWTIEEYWRGHQ